MPHIDFGLWGVLTMARLWAIVASILSSLYATTRLSGSRGAAYRIVTSICLSILIGFAFSVIFILTSFADELIFGYAPGLAGSAHAGEIATIFQMSSAIIVAAALSYLLSRLIASFLRTGSRSGPISN